MKKAVVAVAVILFIFLSACSVSRNSIGVKKSEYLMGTFVSVTVYDFGKADESVIDECFSFLSYYEHIFSYNDSQSELSYVNSNALYEPVSVSEPLYDLISASMEYCYKTEGAFDIGLGKVIEIWNDSTEKGIPPEKENVLPFEGFSGYEHIILDDENRSVYFTDDRTAIHLGACAKGYLEDLALDFLIDNGVNSLLLDFGGSILAYDKENYREFTVGITDPLNVSELAGVINVLNSAVVTSGDYYRFFEHDGIRYHHIIDSATAMPALKDIHGVTVICDSAFAGDCLSTASFVMGSDDAVALLEAEKCGYIIITDESVLKNGVIIENEY